MYLLSVVISRPAQSFWYHNVAVQVHHVSHRAEGAQEMGEGDRMGLSFVVAEAEVRK